MKPLTKPGKVQPAPQPRVWRRHVVPLAILWAGTLLAYSNSFRGGLIYDSASRILQDPRIQAADSQNVSLIFRSDYWYPALGTGLYRPLTTVSYLFNYAVLGNQGQPEGYHALNWVLHSVNASLVYLLAWIMFEETFWACAMAALWALHPVLTESVTNVVGRADLLAGFGVLSGLLFCIFARRAAGGGRRLWFAAAVGAVAIGIFSKESAIVVLPVVLLYEIAFGNDSWKERLTRCAVLATPCVIYGLVRYPVFANAAPPHIPFVDNPLAHAGFLAARWTAVKVIGKQLLLLVWPARLSCDYSYNQVPVSSWADWEAWLAFAACLAIAVAAAVCYRRNRVIFFWIGFSFLALAPTANIFKIVGTVMAERFLYLPAVGFAVCLVAAARLVPKPWSHAALGLIALAFAGRTYARNFDWQDQLSLWRAAVHASPGSYQTHASLAAAAPLDEALPEAAQAIAILDPLPEDLNTPSPYVTAGRRYREKGDLRKSLDLLLRGERIQNTHNERIRRDRLQSGSNTFRAGSSPVYEELASTYRLLGDSEKEMDALRKALVLRPSPETSEQLSAAAYKAGDKPGAAIALLEGLALTPRNQHMAAALVVLYSEMDPNGCAVQPAAGGRAVNLACPFVHGHACAAYRNVAERYTAAGDAATALQVSRYAAERLGCPSTP